MQSNDVTVFANTSNLASASIVSSSMTAWVAPLASVGRIVAGVDIRTRHVERIGRGQTGRVVEDLEIHLDRRGDGEVDGRGDGHCRGAAYILDLCADEEVASRRRHVQSAVSMTVT